MNNYEANLKASKQMSAHHMSSDEDSSIVIAENLTVSAENNVKLKLGNQSDFLHASKYDGSRALGGAAGSDISTELRLKYNNDQNIDLQDFRSNNLNETSDFQGLDMTSRAGLSGYHHSNFQLSSSSASSGNLNFNRYHHHIYDILNERDQPQQQQQPHPQQQQVQHHQQDNQFQIQQQQHQMSMIQEHIGSEAENDQQTSVDLSRTSNYLVSPSPTPSIPYTHTHPDMIRMVSLDLSSNGGNNMINSSHHVRHPSFLSSQIQHSNREPLPEHHRLLASEQLAASNHRLLVDPTAHLIFEQNNRLLADNPGPPAPPPRHVVSPGRGFGAYHHHHHHHHQVASTNYHHHSVKQNLASPPMNQHGTAANYHPFPSYY